MQSALAAPGVKIIGASGKLSSCKQDAGREIGMRSCARQCQQYEGEPRQVTR
jgi:hypothetical protein